MSEVDYLKFWVGCEGIKHKGKAKRRDREEQVQKNTTVRRTIVGTLLGKFCLCKNLLNNRRVWGSFCFFFAGTRHTCEIF